jgi:hypothetical protein
MTVMAEDLKGLLNELSGKLTESQKEKAEKCKSVRELTEFIKSEGVNLSDELLEKVSGGIYYRPENKIDPRLVP